MPKKSVGESFTVELFSVTEKVWIRGRGEIKIFRRKIFVSQCRKIFVGESFFVALISCVEKVWIGGKEYQECTSKIFCLAVPKDYVGESFIVSMISVT